MTGVAGDLLAASEVSSGIDLPASLSFSERLARMPDAFEKGGGATGAAELTFSVGGARRRGGG
eukprot:5297993-Pleurochrysis_carterae.AAC.1